MTPKSLIAPARLARGSVLATQSDARLVDLVRAGHEAAFEAIVKRYRGALSRYVERFLPRERAEDALQQTFVNAYEAMLRDDSDLQLRPWLYRIAHNTALNGLRDRALRHSELPDGLDGVERPDEAVERAQGLRQVLAAVQALPERQRDAIVLRELEGRSYDEIASELRVSDGSVRQLLHRARSTLRTAATAVTPAGLITRLPWAAPTESMAVRVAELCGAGAGGAVVAKVCATALVTGVVAGGVAVAPGGDAGERAVGPDKAAASEEADRGAAAADAGSGGYGGAESGLSGSGGSGPAGGEGDRSGRGDGERSGSGGGDRSGTDRDSSGPGSGELEPDGDSSGPGSGEAEPVDSSGPGSGHDELDGDSSGPGSGGSGSSGSGSSGSGSGSSGSGSGSSGSGSSGSGSGISGSGSDSSGSGSGSSGSGSDSSGAGSSGSGSELETSSDQSGSSGSGSGSE
jgi:RNA polymerase sigma factor (sigma-70 family)